MELPYVGTVILIVRTVKIRELQSGEIVIANCTLGKSVIVIIVANCTLGKSSSPFSWESRDPRKITSA